MGAYVFADYYSAGNLFTCTPASLMFHCINAISSSYYTL